jgi:hypothetical protein
MSRDSGIWKLGMDRSISKLFVTKINVWNSLWFLTKIHAIAYRLLRKTILIWISFSTHDRTKDRNEILGQETLGYSHLRRGEYFAHFDLPSRVSSKSKILTSIRVMFEQYLSILLLEQYYYFSWNVWAIIEQKCSELQMQLSKIWVLNNLLINLND